jgi:hypothetical protein
MVSEHGVTIITSNDELKGFYKTADFVADITR